MHFFKIQSFLLFLLISFSIKAQNNPKENLSNSEKKALKVIKMVNKNLNANHNISEINFTVKHEVESHPQTNTFNMELIKVKNNNQIDLDKINTILKNTETEIEKLDGSDILKTIYEANGSYKNEELHIKQTHCFIEDKLTALDLETLSPFETIKKGVITHLNSSCGFNIKSGLFNVCDSVSVNGKMKDSDENTLPIIKENLINKENNFEFIEFQNDYKYDFITTQELKGKQVYHLRFKPKSKHAKYSGDLYVSSKSFAIIKVNYRLVHERKLDENMNMRFLFGIKGAITQKSTTVIYQKNKDDKYFPSSIKRNIIQSMHTNRKFKLVECKPSDGMKVKIDLTLDITENKTATLLITEN
ncbi:hypothetical protein [Mesonia aquimarina]|uniref:hypothetical protein n=1 Tax=Mesonia aquimarina TaxID=1504967 RepID=UPI000EF59D78|nr:hypothetical protein [Mesonia aquimarina]